MRRAAPMLVLAAALVLVAAAAGALTPFSTFPSGAISVHTSHEIPQLDAVASRLAGRHVRVDCWSTPDWRRMTTSSARLGASELAYAAAFTNPALAQIQISPEICSDFAEIVAHRPLPLVSLAHAVGVLAHESRHAAGVRAENLAECGGIRTIPRTAMLLGYSRAKALLLQHVYRGTLYPLDPPRYRTPPCPAGLPGRVLTASAGSRAVVRMLTAHVRAVARALPGWRPLALPPAPLSPCSALRSRDEETGRFELTFAHGANASVYVGATQLRTPAEVRRVLAGVPRSLACFARTARTALHRLDPHATVVTSRVPTQVIGTTRWIRGLRTSFTSRALPRGRHAVRDLLVLVLPAQRLLVSLAFDSVGGPLPVGLERRAVTAAIHGR